MNRPYEYIESFDGIYGSRPRAIRGLQYIVCLLKTFAQIVRRRTDIVHIQLWTHDFREIAQVGLARILGKRVVLTAHEVKGWRSGGQLAESSDPGCEGELARGFKWMLAQAAGTIVHNKYSYDQLTSTYSPKKPVVIVPYINHVESLGTLPDRARARDQLKLPQDKQILLFFGNCRPEKGLDLALQALAELKDEDGLLFVTAGKMKSAEEAFFRGLVDELALGSLVRMDVGLVPDEAAIAYYRAANLVVLPYRHIYDSGVAMTASTCARAVLTSDLPPMLELTENGRLGLHFRVGSAHDLALEMKKTLGMGEALDALGAQAREKVLRERDPDAIAAQILTLYEGRLQTSPHRAIGQ
jgi:glycosyltransferase involved in cell wall biosynthesis